MLSRFPRNMFIRSAGPNRPFLVFRTFVITCKCKNGVPLWQRWRRERPSVVAEETRRPACPESAMP